MGKIKVRTQESIGRRAIENPGSRNCSLGISLGKTYFSKERVEAYMKFGLEFFDRIQVFIADYPERWNYMAIKGLDMDEATRRALQHGQQDGISKFAKVRRKLENDGLPVDRISLVTFQEAMDQNPDYPEVLGILQDAYQSDQEVRRDFRNWAEAGVGKRIRETRKTKRAFEQALETATNYTIEEAAMMVCNAERNPLKFVDIYPGSYHSKVWSFMRNLNEGRYPELWDRLEMQEGYGYIDVRVQESLADRIATWTGNHLGSNPQERRDARRKTRGAILSAQNMGSIALATVVPLAGPTAILTADVITRDRVEQREYNGAGYTLVYRKSGAIEVMPHNNRTTTWHDTDGDGKTIEHGITYIGQFLVPLKDEKFLEWSNNVYAHLTAQEGE